MNCLFFERRCLLFPRDPFSFSLCPWNVLFLLLSFVDRQKRIYSTSGKSMDSKRGSTGFPFCHSLLCVLAGAEWVVMGEHWTKYVNLVLFEDYENFSVQPNRMNRGKPLSGNYIWNEQLLFRFGFDANMTISLQKPRIRPTAIESRMMCRFAERERSKILFEEQDM